VIFAVAGSASGADRAANRVGDTSSLGSRSSRSGSTVRNCVLEIGIPRPVAAGPEFLPLTRGGRQVTPAAQPLDTVDRVVRAHRTRLRDQPNQPEQSEQTAPPGASARRVRHSHRTVLRAVHTLVISRKAGQVRPCRVGRTIELCGGNVGLVPRIRAGDPIHDVEQPPGGDESTRRDASQPAPNTAHASVVKFVEAATIACCHGSSALVGQRR
jgi:hypothetical protein